MRCCRWARLRTQNCSWQQQWTGSWRSSCCSMAWVCWAGRTTGTRHVGNALYGAALLELQPSRGQMEALFGVVRRVAQGLHYICLAQLLLACQRLVEQDNQLRQQRGSDIPPPSQDPYHMYYPGDDVMDKLLDRALQLAHNGSLDKQAASQILGACGALGYLPAPAALRELLAGAAPISKSYLPTECCFFMFLCWQTSASRHSLCVACLIVK
jgi:hypothetical protein